MITATKKAREKWMREIPKNKILRRSHYLRNLHELDIDNLLCGRITRWAMGEARRRLEAYPAMDRLTEDMLLADELNDMLEACR